MKVKELELGPSLSASFVRALRGAASPGDSVGLIDDLAMGGAEFEVKKSLSGFPDDVFSHPLQMKPQ